MLALGSGAKIFLCRGATDLRKGFEGLSGLVSASIEEPLTSHCYFIFLNRTRDRMKILYFDNDGLAIWYKRLEKGCFPKKEGSTTPIDRREFLMLLEGVVPKRLHKRYKE